MIFGNINNLKEYTFLDSQIQKCFAYAANNDLKSFEKGSHEIEGDQLFVNIVEYVTTTPDERFWEAHKQYLDIHVMLDGSERIDLNFIENMEQKEFEPEKDFLPLEGDLNSHVVLHSGDFLICYPADAHRTAVIAEKSQSIKKAIFKVCITK